MRTGNCFATPTAASQGTTLCVALTLLPFVSAGGDILRALAFAAFPRPLTFLPLHASALILPLDDRPLSFFAFAFRPFVPSLLDRVL